MPESAVMPTIGRPYIVRNRAGDRITRTPVELLMENGVPMVRYTTPGGWYRICPVADFVRWASRAEA